MPRFLRSKTLLIALGAALLIAAYAVVGFVAAPKLIRSALLKDIPEAIDATASVGEIHVNPFLFQVTIDDFALAGAQGEKLLGFQRLFIDFQLSSVWYRAYTFGNIDIAAPYVSAVVAKDGVLNLLQLRPKPTPRKPDRKSAPLPAIRIGSFRVSQGVMTYEDRSRADVFAARLEPINFELRDFATGIAGGVFNFTGASTRGERIAWHGHVAVDPLESDGEFQVNGLLAQTLWEYAQDKVNFVIDSGSIDLAATYRFSLADPAATNLKVDLSKLSLTDFTVRPRPAPNESQAEPWLTIPALAVTGGAVDLGAHRAHVDLVSLSGPRLTAWLGVDKTLNLMQLAATPPGPSTTGVTAVAPVTPAAPTAGAHGVVATAAPVAPRLTASANTSAAASVPWTFELRQFEIRDASITAEDRSVRPAVKMLLAPFSVQVDGVSEDSARPVSVTLETGVNDSGSLTVKGEVTPWPLTADLDGKLAGIDLTAIQPYLAQHTAMTLLSGNLSLDGRLHYGARPKMPTMQFAGNIEVDKLRTVDDALHQDFIDWDRLDILGLNYAQSPDRLDIEQIVAHAPYARVIIESDASMNVKRVLKMPTTAAGSADVAPTLPVAGTPDAGRAQGRTLLADNPGNVASAPAPQTLPISIKQIVVQAGQANFADLSVQPNFATGIQKLAGSIVGLSSKPGTRAKVALTGAIDAFSPVSITGEVNVLGPLYTDLTMSFRNISLPLFDPYSGKFAGYNIAKGKLTTELHYKVDGRRLDAQHHIVVEQLEFGDKTVSKEAVSLPIKLAVALLKDRNGVIDLNIPVTGSLDDPRFRLAPLIWQVFVDILEKAVTEPFALLGALFGGGPDLQFIAFQPGLGTLDATGADKARAVVKALIERPQLRIDVPIAVVPDVDRPALVAARFDALLRAAQGAKGGPKIAVATTAPRFEQLDPAAQLELLTQVYAQTIGAALEFPESVRGLKSKPASVAAKIDFLSKAIHDHIAIGDGELQSLGQQRAMALQQALLADAQVEPERVFLVANDKATAKDGAVMLELSLK